MRSRVVTAGALAGALVLSGWSLRTQYAEEAPTGGPHVVDVSVSAGQWQVVTPRAGKPSERVRVLSLSRTRELHPDSGGDSETLPAPGEFAVVTVECECPDREEFTNPVGGLVDARGRVWEEASGLYGDYAERGPGVVSAGDIEDAPPGTVRYAVIFPVASDARELVVTAQDRSGEDISRVGWTGAER